MHDRNFATEFAIEAFKGTPPVTIAAAAVAGMSLNDWLLATTLVYVLLQILHLVLFKMFGFSFAKRKGPPDAED